MTSISAVKARRSFGNLLNIVSLRHEELTIERAGKPVAKLVPIDDMRPSSAQGKLDIRHARGLGKHVWAGVNADTYVEGERKTWD